LSIDPQISTGHMIATFFGFTVWGFWVQYKKNLIL
jgi:hypothetical protein